MDHIDELLKQYLSNKPSLKPERGAFVPDEFVWRQFFDGRLSEQDMDRMSAYLAQDPEARSFALKTRKMLAGSSEAENHRAPEAWVAAAKKRVSTNSTPSPKRKNHFVIWYSLAAVSFGLSFWLSRYYMQFLVLTVLAGMKAIMDQRQAKMQIMIYQALESGKEINSDRLKEFGLKK